MDFGRHSARAGGPWLAIGVAWALVAPASAEDAELEEIIVTAQKRQELVQDVPLSMVIVSGGQIEEMNLGRISDLQAYVPGLFMSETALGSNIAIRGVFSGTNQGFWQSVGTYVDGIYRGRSQQTRAPFLDLERVEILRGSQNILFGRNSLAGALNLTTAQPTEALEASLGMLYEPELDERELTAILSGPISSHLLGRLAVRGTESEGYMRNLTLGGRAPQRDEHTIRGSLAWQPSDRLDIRLKLESSQFDVTGRHNEVIVDRAAAAGPFAGLDYSEILLSFGQDRSVLNTTQDYARSSNGDISDNDVDEGVLTVDYQIGNLTLSSVTGYSGYEYREICDCDFTGGDVFKVLQSEDFHQRSQELRLASAADRDLSFIVGLYYQTSILHFFDSLALTDTSIIIPVVNTLTQSTNGQYLGNTATPRYFDLDTASWSVFGQASWMLGDRFRLTAGLRVSDEMISASRRLSITALDYAPLSQPAATITPLLYAGVFNVRAHETSGDRNDMLSMPSLGVQYDFGEDSMGYLTLAQAAKSGAFDPRSNNPLSAGGSFEFEDERAASLEAGMKLRPANRSTEFDVAVYRTEIEDMQTSVFDGVLGYNVRNAGEAVSQGLELEARWAATTRLTLSASVSFMDFEFKDYFGQCYFGQPADAPDGVNCSYSGKTNQYVPDHSSVFLADYVVGLRNGRSLRTMIDVQYTDEFFRMATLDPQQIQKAFSTLNARVSLSSALRTWELALIGKNLTGEGIVRYSSDVPLAGRVFGAPGVWGFVDPPRTVALQGVVRF